LTSEDLFQMAENCSLLHVSFMVLFVGLFYRSQKLQVPLIGLFCTSLLYVSFIELTFEDLYQMMVTTKLQSTARDVQLCCRFVAVRVAACYSMLQCVAVSVQRCRQSVVVCVAVRCSMLQCVGIEQVYCHCVAVCVAVCCGVLQCFASCFSV